MELDQCSTNSDSLKEDNEVGKPKPPFWGFGIFCATMASIVYTLNSMLVKVITSVGALQLSASRCIVQFLILLPYVAYNWRFKCIDMCGPPGMLKFLLLLACTGPISSILLYQAIRMLSVGDAVTLQFTNVIFAAVLAFILLKEPLTLPDVLLGILTMVGVVFISKPSFLFGGFGLENSENSAIGVLMGVISGFMAGSAVVLLRRMGKGPHPSLNIFYYSIIGSISTACVLAATGSFEFPCFHELPYIILLGVTGITAQIFTTVALHYERAAVFPVVRSFQIVLVLIMEVLILHDTPSILSLIGSGLIFFSILGIASRKLHNTISKKREVKNK